jgi:hypothetical protein
MPEDLATSPKTELTASSVSATLTQVVLPMGLVIDEVTFSGQAITVQMDPLDIRAPHPATVTATVKLTSLDRYLETDAPGGLKNFRCEGEDGWLYVNAVKKVIFDVAVKAKCRVSIRDQKELWVDLASVEVMGGASVTNLVQSQLANLNPLFSVAELPIVARLTSAEVGTDQIVIRLEVGPPNA